MGYACKILADSVSPDGARLTTFEATFPRIVLAEFNTHRMLSRNSASSRAIPVEKRIAQVRADPFVPAAFGKNKPGMQASENLGGDADIEASVAWNDAMSAAVSGATWLAKIGVHKQLANRLLEPFLWHTAIISATELDNFFALRCHPDAQPEIRTIAEMMRDAMSRSEPSVVGDGEWHLPYVDRARDADLFDNLPPHDIALISCARCARVSYLTHDGKRDPLADLSLARKLQASGHMSPFEHAATPADGSAMIGNFKGWRQLRKTLPHEDNFANAQKARTT